MDHFEIIMTFVKNQKSESGSEEMNGPNPDNPQIG